MKTSKASKKEGKGKEKKGKDLGLGLKEPERKCNEPNCPWHGKLSVRGRVFKGNVKAAKSRRTVIVEWGYHKYVPKYQRYERRKTRITAHNPPCLKAREGDEVVIAECRPLSKTKSFVVVSVEKRGVSE